jgi:hypothetical protein
MKKGLLIISLVLSQQLVAQKASPALSNSYSKTELLAFEQDEQGTINVLNYAIDHACYTVLIPEGKDVSQFSMISLKSKNDIRFTDYQLQIKDRTQYFKIEGTNELLVVKSINVLKLEMQNKK